MGELANCPQCGELFVKGAISVCQKCYQEEEKKFEKVYKFIRKRKNRTATMYEVASETGVEESLITKWIKEKRIHPSQAPNFNYPCEKCGNPISEGKLCPSCTDTLRKNMTEEADVKQEAVNTMTYYNVNKNK
ncbi:TIGR03826 family flagellar region protein [Piscibacillus salipiscarius]|uniref:TIGR03826 family flagellar region protein n=1 Tax=Piscibacillus salipiscarius TaxID=299480 RepID=A0ABW5QAR4_9BACI|nr:TIGR03826 family flagellar region protein [Piscibacillus salipiscarius]